MSFVSMFNSTFKTGNEKDPFEGLLEPGSPICDRVSLMKDFRHHAKAATRKFLIMMERWLTDRPPEWQHNIVPFIAAVTVCVLVQGAANNPSFTLTDGTTDGLLKPFDKISSIPCLGKHLRDLFNGYAACRVPLQSYSPDYVRSQIRLLSYRLLFVFSEKRFCDLENCQMSHVDFSVLTVDKNYLPSSSCSQAFSQTSQSGSLKFDSTAVMVIAPALDRVCKANMAVPDKQQKIFLIFNTTFRAVIEHVIDKVPNLEMLPFGYEMTVMMRSILDFPYKSMLTLNREADADFDGLINPVSGAALLASLDLLVKSDQTMAWQMLLRGAIFAMNHFTTQEKVPTHRELADQVDLVVERVVRQGGRNLEPSDFSVTVHVSLSLLELLSLCTVAEPHDTQFHDRIGASTVKLFHFIASVDNMELREYCLRVMLRLLVLSTYSRVTKNAWQCLDVCLRLFSDCPKGIDELVCRS